MKSLNSMTSTQLITEVSKFYKGSLDIYKALKLFEIEYGYEPEIVQPENIINESFIQNAGYPDFVTPEALSYMKELQESGAVNMFSSVSYIQNALALSIKQAKELLMIYMKDYTMIYHPEELL